MIEIPHIPHPLKRDGKSQAQRTVTALSPDFVKVDERTRADLLEFVLKYARQIRFYDTRLNASDWSDFFRRSLPFIIAGISKTDTRAVLNDFNNLAKEAQRFENMEGVRLLLRYVREVFWQIHHWSRELAEDSTGTGFTLNNLINTNLAFAAGQLREWGLEISAWSEEDFAGNLPLGSAWKLREDLVIEPLLVGLRGSHETKLRIAVKKIEKLFQLFRSAMETVVDKAALSVPKSLNDSSAHPPHLGLLFAFLDLFEKARDNPADKTASSLNAATQKHLDFFYEKVLGLTFQEADPDKAQLVFELAKRMKPFKIDKGTVFVAGKDSKGVPIHFGLEQEIVLTHTQVAGLRTMYLEQEYPDSPKHPVVKKVRIAPVANSFDGLGEAFPKEGLPSWKTLGWDHSKMPAEEAGLSGFQPYPDARLGLVAASKVLHLKGGTRTIKLKIHCKLPDSDLEKFTGDPIDLNEALSFSYYEISEETFESLGFSDLAKAFLANRPFPIRYADHKLYAETIEKVLGEKYDADDKANDIGILESIKLKKPSFRAFLTGEKEWMEFTPDEVNLSKNGEQNRYELHIRLELNESAPPVTWYNPEVHGEQLDTHLPAMRLELVGGDFTREGAGQIYHFLRYMQITGITFDVAVCNLRDLVIHTDAGPQEAGKPFMPFGPAPKLGNRFFVGSEEVFRKKWDQFALRVGWKDKPGSFEDHYANYTKVGLDEGEILMDAGVRVNNEWREMGPKQVFSRDAMFAPCSVTDSPSIWLFDAPPPSAVNEAMGSLNPSPDFARDGYVRFTLRGSTFLHDKFGEVFARQATAQAMLSQNRLIGGAIYKINDAYRKHPEDSAEFGPFNRNNSIVELPNPPYTPVIEELSIDYTASAGSPDIRLYHLYPWEGAFKKEQISAGPSVLPRFEDEGSLFIGLKDLAPGEKLHLLFQLAESTANAEAEPAAVSWYYLKSNEWKPLGKDTQVLSDATAGLLKPGVVEIAVPGDIDKNNTILPNDLHWLKASAPQRADAVSEAVALHTQAALVAFLPAADSDTTRLAKSLPPESIAKPLEEIAAVKKISQPYPSFGGKPGEDKPSYYRRNSERLRHKGRAVTLFDYERIVLQAFPEIYKVKCITHTLGLPSQVRDFQSAPGHVLLAVIPDLKQMAFANRFEPKATRSLLDAVEQYMSRRVSPFVQVRALNPLYEKFWVSCKVKFMPGKSIDYSKQQLLTDLQKLLAPWAFDEGREIDFGGVVYKSVLLRFIEELDYVDYLTDFKLKYEAPGAQQVEADQITPGSARSILVAGEHEIDEIESPCCKTNGNTKLPGAEGIGYKAVGEMEPVHSEEKMEHDCL